MSAEFLEYSDSDHAYYVDGVRQYSVTEILCRAGLVSPFSQRDEVARWRGDSVHRLCAREDSPGIDVLDLRSVRPELRNYIRAWRKYKDNSGIRYFELVEHRVDSRQHGFSGRLDRAIAHGAGATIWDLKTGAIPTWAGLQLAAYGLALNPKRVFARAAIELRADGTYVVRQYSRSSYLEDCRTFLRLLDQVRKGESNGS